MCKRGLNSKLKGNLSNGYIDSNNFKELDINNFIKIKFGSSEPARSQQPKIDKNTVYYIDDILRVVKQKV